jgi:hypothetical protein
VIAGLDNTRQNIAHFGLVVDKLEQRLTARPLLADTKNVFGGWVQPRDQEMLVEQNDARTERVKNGAGVLLQRSVVTGAARSYRVR